LRGGFRSIAESGGLAVSLLVALAAAFVVDRFTPPPTADVLRGSEAAFARGLFPREIDDGVLARRWTKPAAVVSFRTLPGVPLGLQVRVAGHERSVFVSAAGVPLGAIAPGRFAGNFDVAPPADGRLDLELRTDGFATDDGRILGTLLNRVSLTYPSPRTPPRLPPLALVLAFVGPALLAVLGGRAAGLPRIAASLVALTVSVLEAALVWPCGVVRSPYATTLAVLLAAGVAAAVAFAAFVGRRRPEARPWAFAAILLAVVVQGIAATHPLLVVSDAVFHAHNLEAVSRGELFLTSLTPHARPFRFPYGVSFYVALVPFLRLGVDAVDLVQSGAAIAGIAGSAALFALLALTAGARVAGIAVGVFQLLPVTFDLFSFGNLSNVFGQAVTVAFFAWWTGGAPGGWPIGAMLLAVAGLAHLSSLIVITILAAALALFRGRALVRDRARLVALVVGLGLAGLYYLHFWPLVAEQLPRLSEGSGREGGPGVWDALWSQARAALQQWGLPAIILALLGRPHPSGDGLDRELGAYWAAGALLAAAAVVSPLEARYLYALGVPLAIAAAQGSPSAPRWRTVLSGVLLALQAALAVRGVAEALVHRYRR
jgi:hypothetical protein